MDRRTTKSRQDLGQGSLERDLTWNSSCASRHPQKSGSLENVKTSQASLERERKVKAEADELSSKVQGQYDDIVMLERQLAKQNDAPTMPVIPKDVAIAIFREGTLFGVEAACDELEGQTINISESDYVGDFSISFERDVDLDDFIDFDWMRRQGW